MTLVVKYPSKKALKESIGQRLNYMETSLFGPEYQDNGILVVNNRPNLTGHKREFFAKVTMESGLIKGVK